MAMQRSAPRSSAKAAGVLKKGKHVALVRPMKAVAGRPGSAQQPQRRPRRRFGVEEAKAAAKMSSEKWRQLQDGMDEKWPQPAYMNGELGHTRYRDETYAAVTRWTAETKILYRPHAKAPGSKSHVRYERYSKAKTVAQALKLGSWPADWCWDYERGFIKVLGPVREEPLDISKVTDERSLTDVDRAINRWYKRELARNLGLKIADLYVGKGSGESLIMRAHRLVAQREAKKILEATQRAGRKVSEQEVLSVLQAWAFAKNTARLNVQPEDQEYVFSDTLGLLRDRTGDIHLTAATKTYPEVVRVLNQYLLDRLPAGLSDFKWTSLNLNCNYAAKLHRDATNFGPSFIKAFGDFSGGLLKLWPEDDKKTDKMEALKEKDTVAIDLKKGLAMFNGYSAHYVEPFQGERYTVVYFCCGCYKQAPEQVKAGCISLGMQFPAQDEDPHRLLGAPLGYSAAARASAAGGRKGPPSFRFFPSAKLDAGTPARRGRSGAGATPSAKAPAVKKQGLKAKASQGRR